MQIWLKSINLAQRLFGTLVLYVHGSQRAEAILNKIPNNISKTYTGLISVLQGFQKCIA